MHTIKFEEKHGDRVVQAESRNHLFATILSERVADGCWYDDKDQAAAQEALDNGLAEAFMRKRRDQQHEYETYDDLYIERL